MQALNSASVSAGWVSRKCYSVIHELREFAIEGFAQPNTLYVNGTQHFSRTLDNNVRYVALQNLGQLVSVNFGPIGNNVDVLQSSLEGVFLFDRDGSIVLHSLRLFRLLAKHEPIPASSSVRPPPLMQFWLAFLRPRVFQLVEERGDPTLKAALCDCLSAIGEHVYQHLPLDKRKNSVFLRSALSGDI